MVVSPAADRLLDDVGENIAGLLAAGSSAFLLTVLETRRDV